MTDDGRVLSELSIPHSQVGFEALGELLDEFDEVAINIERPDGLLVDWLVAQQYPVFVTAPAIVAKRRPRRTKDDRGDAYLLAELAQRQDPDCRPLVQQSTTILHLRQLFKAYDDALAELGRDANRLFWTLRKYYPTILQAFRCRHSLTFLAFLEAFPTPAAARVLTPGDLARFLREVGYFQSSRYGHIYQALQVPTPTARGEEGYVEAVQMIIPRLRCVVLQRKYLHKRIVEVYETHPDSQWWRTLPGASGPLTPARLLAAIGDDRRRFPSAGDLQAVAGTVPITRRSGKQVRVEFRVACSKPLRKAVDQFTRQCVRYSGWLLAYYHSQLARGHSSSRAYRALGNRWLSIIWKLWQSGETYEEAIHVANRSRRGQPVPA
jgi:transposase